MRRRSGAGWVLILAVILVPLIEIWAILQVGRVIGPWWTIVLLLADGIVGGWLIRREGSAVWRALQEALQRGEMPARHLADGALILVGGTLMLTPGFVTDAVGMLLILPFTRPLARRLLTRVVQRRLLVTGLPPDARRPGAGPRGPVVRGDVIDD